MDYELGLKQLKQRLYNTGWYQEFLVYEQRLLENLEQERLYGTNEQGRSERARVVGQLNRLASQVGTSFNELCQFQATKAGDEAGRDVQGRQQSSRSPQGSTQGCRVYISYHENDKNFLEELHRYLNQHVTKGKIEYWDRTKIKPGANKREETSKALHTAQVAILLVSADYLAPDDPVKNELSVLLKAKRDRGTEILCVIVCPCLFTASDLEPFQPINAQPLNGMSKNKREEVWNNVAMEVRAILQAST